MKNHIGIDAIEIARIRRIMDKFGSQFYKRLFTDAERVYCDRQKKPELHYAARFCAKESVSKALKTGIAAGIRWTDIEIVNDPVSGAPSVLLHNRALEIFSLLGGSGLDVSLSHSDTIATAAAVMTLEPPAGKTP